MPPNNADAALLNLDACSREHLPSKRLVPERAQLESPGAMLLLTRLGPLDVLGTVAAGWRYHELMDRSRTIEFADAPHSPSWVCPP